MHSPGFLASIGLPQVTRKPKVSQRTPEAAVARRDETIRLVDDELLHGAIMPDATTTVELIKDDVILSTSME